MLRNFSVTTLVTIQKRAAGMLTPGNNNKHKRELVRKVLLEARMSVYRVIVFLHVISALVFMMAHGVSAMMMFKISRERKYENLCNYLEISSAAMLPAMRALEGVILTGITLTIWARWYHMGWIWLSLGLFVAIGVVMGKFASSYLGSVRRAMGMVSPSDLKKGIRPLLAPQEVLMEVLAQGKPRLVATAGLSGLAAITFLMVAKPF